MQPNKEKFEDTKIQKLIEEEKKKFINQMCPNFIKLKTYCKL